MKKSDFKGKKVTVMGLGLHGGGVATARFFAEAGARVTVTDLKSAKELKISIDKLAGLKNIAYVLGQHRIEDFAGADLVVKGPSIPWTSKHIQEALSRKIPVEIDSSLFFKMCKLPIIGVTGTKGKTTTASLIAEILRNSGVTVFAAGIGQKPVMDLLDKTVGTKKGAVVFELSSWRLSALGRAKMSPQIAVVTNIYPDHLNFYGSMEKYVADKKFIFENQAADDFVILNRDIEKVAGVAEGTKSKKIFFSAEGRECSDCVYARDEKILHKSDGEEREICGLDDIKIRGSHNIQNVLAAVAAGLAFGIAPEKICDAIKSFKGIPHRLEFVREFQGVKYYNDTAATMPDAAIAGLNSFSERITLIAGGADKKLEFVEFANAIGGKANKVILLKGEATEKIKKELKKIAKEKIVDSEFDSMEKAVIRAKSISGPGDIVLLSPGAASFGLFLNEFDRGDKFREAVRTL